MTFGAARTGKDPFGAVEFPAGCDILDVFDIRPPLDLVVFCIDGGGVNGNGDGRPEGVETTEGGTLAPLLPLLGLFAGVLVATSVDALEPRSPGYLLFEEELPIFSFANFN